MTLKFIKGSHRVDFLNVIIDDKLILGECNLNVVNGKKTKTIRIVRQDKWYLYIPILIHEFAHYFMDLIFPFTGNNYEVISKHNIVEVIFNLNLMYFLDPDEAVYAKKI